MQIVQNIIWMMPVSFRQKRFTVPIGFRLFAIAQLYLSYTIGKYSAKWDRGFKLTSDHWLTTRQVSSD